MHVAIVHTTYGSYIDVECIYCVVVGEDLFQLYGKMASQGVCQGSDGWVLNSPDHGRIPVLVEFLEENG